VCDFYFKHFTPTYEKKQKDVSVKRNFIQFKQNNSWY